MKFPGVISMRKDLPIWARSEEHTSELQSQSNLVCRLLLEKKKHTSTLAMPRPKLQRMPTALTVMPLFMLHAGVTIVTVLPDTPRPCPPRALSSALNYTLPH